MKLRVENGYILDLDVVDVIWNDFGMKNEVSEMVRFCVFSLLRYFVQSWSTLVEGDELAPC